MSFLKSVLTIAAIGTGLHLLTKGAGLSNFYKKMNYYISAKLHSITWSGLVVKVNITIANPTDTEVKMTKPFVRIYSGNIEVGHSDPENIEIVVLPHASTKIENISITIPWGTEILRIIKNAGTTVANLIMTGANEPAGINLTVKAMMDVAGINDIVQTSEVSL